MDAPPTDMIESLAVLAMQNDSTLQTFADLTAVLPVLVNGYRPDGEDRQYGHDTLFELLNGGAEVYRSLNVRGVVSRSYTKQGAPEVLVDIFDMGSARDAYGAYHHDMREGPSAYVGRESEVTRSSLFFWKYRYFVSVVAFADTPESRAGVVDIANVVAGRIEVDGEVPEIAGWLPQSGLVASQVHYFHTWPLLNRYYRFAEDNLLELAADTEGILARYQEVYDTRAGRLPTLLVVRYPSVERAERARQSFQAGFLRDSDSNVSRFDAQGWVGFARGDNVLVGVFDSGSRTQAESLLTAVERRRKGES